MLTFRKAPIFLAVLALFAGLARSVSAQHLIVTHDNKTLAVPEEMFFQLFKLNIEPRKLLVQQEERGVTLSWYEYFYPDKGNSHTFRIFLKPGTDKEWFWYHSFDKVAAKPGKEGKFEIYHEATVWVAAKKMVVSNRFPWLTCEAKPKVLVIFRGSDIEKSKDKLGEAIEKELKIRLPSSIEM